MDRRARGPWLGAVGLVAVASGACWQTPATGATSVGATSPVPGATSPGPIAPSPSRCDLPDRLELLARRYANVDIDDPTFDQWTPWRVDVHVTAGATGARTRPVKATVVMAGDGLRWRFEAGGTVDCEASQLELRFATHEPMALTLALSTGEVRVTSIDDEWRVVPDGGNTGARPRS